MLRHLCRFELIQQTHFLLKFLATHRYRKPEEVSHRLGEAVTFPVGINDGDPKPGRGIGLVFKGIFSSPRIE